MTELVIGAALGFIVGECALVGLKHVARFLQRDQRSIRLRNLFAWQGSGLVGRLARHASVFAAGAGVFALAAWSVTNYLAARDAQRAVNTASARTVTARPLSADDDLSEVAYEGPSAVQVADPDPYSDPEFKTPHQPHQAGTSRRLTEILLQRSETRARADLLKETQERAQRSQYDCEAAARAARYLKSGLDVWGFAAWQKKYFPLDTYKGATLVQCKTIEKRIDSADGDPNQTVAAEDAPRRALDP